MAGWRVGGLRSEEAKILQDKEEEIGRSEALAWASGGDQPDCMYSRQECSPSHPFVVALGWSGSSIVPRGREAPRVPGAGPRP
jgi:hypothetical protein